MDIIVIKIGSNIITSRSGLNERRIRRIVKDISTLHDMGYNTVIVSSGAIAAGRIKLNIHRPIHDIKLKQASAAIGQSSLVWTYEKAFKSFNKKVAQILLTREGLSDRKSYINVKNTLITLLSYGVIPVINENDTVAIDEIRFGDNDQLAALVASLLEARRLVMLSDVDGLFTDNPDKYKKAKIIKYVKEITPEIERKAKSDSSMFGTGGMYSKLIAAKKATENGIAVNIINGKKSGLMLALFDGKEEGTAFEPMAKKYGARKGWIAFGVRSKGELILDEGATQAITKRGKSLLPSGIKSIDGNFDRGDAVYCIDTDGRKIAKGLTNYSTIELKKIIGEKSSQVEKILGYKYSDEIIHRDNMAVI